jgi:hypothetical protein
MPNRLGTVPEILKGMVLCQTAKNLSDILLMNPPGYQICLVVRRMPGTIILSVDHNQP